MMMPLISSNHCCYRHHIHFLLLLFIICIKLFDTFGEVSVSAFASPSSTLASFSSTKSISTPLLSNNNIIGTRREVSMDSLGEIQDTSASLTIGAVQPHLRDSDTCPLTAANHAIELIRQAAAGHQQQQQQQQQNNDGKKNKKIDLFVLPELSPIGYCEDTFQSHLRKNDAHNIMKQSKDRDLGIDTTILDKIDKMFSSLAEELDCYICYGTIGTVFHEGSDGKSKSKSNKHFTIRQNVMDNDGHLVCHYDKIHLCNYGDCAETRFFVPGNEARSFNCRGFQVGIIICADMRNPSLCRQLVASKAHKCDIILQPAAFSRDISFRTWNSFRETRAVENSVYFVAVNYAGEYYGNTAFVQPWVDENHEPDVLGIEEGVLVKEVRRDVLNRVREDFPYYKQLMSEGWHISMSTRS